MGKEMEKVNVLDMYRLLFFNLVTGPDLAKIDVFDVAYFLQRFEVICSFF